MASQQPTWCPGSSALDATPEGGQGHCLDGPARCKAMGTGCRTLSCRASSPATSARNAPDWSELHRTAVLGRTYADTRRSSPRGKARSARSLNRMAGLQARTGLATIVPIDIGQRTAPCDTSPHHLASICVRRGLWSGSR